MREGRGCDPSRRGIVREQIRNGDGRASASAMANIRDTGKSWRTLWFWWYISTIYRGRKFWHKSANAHQGAPFNGRSSWLKDFQRFRRNRLVKDIIALSPFVGRFMMLLTSASPGRS